MLNPKDAYAQWGIDLVREVAAAVSQVRRACQDNSKLQPLAQAAGSDLMETLVYRRLCLALKQTPTLGQQPRALRLATLKAMGAELHARGFASDMAALKQALSTNSPSS